MTSPPPRWRPPPPPESITIYPDPTQDTWRHSLGGPAMGLICGRLRLPASATPAQARQAAENMLTELGHTYHQLDFTITWHPPDANGWITGEIQAAPRPA